MRTATLLVLALTRVATAAPIAKLVVDVDGDGMNDQLELDDSGTLQIGTKAGATSVPLARSITRGTLTAALIRSVPTIVADITSPDGDDAVVLERDPRFVWRVTTRVKVGGVGLDNDYAIEVEATPDGVFRYQSRPGIRRCDGQSAYLFAEGFDGVRFRRLSKLPTNMPASATVIPAHADTMPAMPPLLYQARVASYEVGADDAGALGIPHELDDGNPATQWREELASDGEGQFFTFEPRAPSLRATEIRIVAGAKSFNRPHRIGVVSAHGAWHVDIPDGANDPAGTAYVADLPTPIEGCVTIVLESSYGIARNHTAIGELEVFADGERAGGGEALLARLIALGKDGAENAGAVLARRGAAGVAAIDAELGKPTNADARARLVHALVQLHDPTAAPILARIATQDWLRERDLLDVIAALGAAGDVQALHDLAVKRELQLETRVAAIHAIKTAGKAPDALVDLAGSGPRELRHAVIDVLTGVAVPTLAPLAAKQTSPSISGDLWRAVTRRGRAVPSERSDAIAAITAALPAATDYERRYRLIDGIAALGDAAALHALATLLAGLPATEETAAFKQVAARAVAESPRPEALDLLVEFASDRDPGVRLASLGAIPTAEAGTPGAWHAADGPDGIDRVIITLLSTDSWPEVRRRAAQTLGGRCDRIGPARALADAVARDSALAVRGDALAGLVQCHAAGIAELLAHTWDDGKAPIELRQRAVDLAVALGDPVLATKLLGNFRAWRGASITSAEALALVQNAAYAIGRLAPAGAADALIDALEDAAFPEIVAAAATSLGLLGPTCPTTAKTKLRVLSANEENQIAVAAKRAYAQCAK